MATNKTASTTKAATKTRGAKKPGRGDDLRTRQIGPGWFNLYQDSLEVGQVVVQPTSGGSTEYFFLYTYVTDPSKAKYVWPSSTATPITTTFVYKGTLPPKWTNAQDYQASLAPTQCQLVTASCVNS